MEMGSKGDERKRGRRCSRRVMPTSDENDHRMGLCGIDATLAKAVQSGGNTKGDGTRSPSPWYA